MAEWFLSSFLPTGCLGVLYGTISGDIRDYLGLQAFVRTDPTPPIYLIGILVCNFCADCAATGIKRALKGPKFGQNATNKLN